MAGGRKRSVVVHAGLDEASADPHPRHVAFAA